MMFTPGPWLATPNSALVYALNPQGTNRFDALMQGGWTVEAKHRTEAAELLANARLIAAAPDMYKALLEVEAHHAKQNALKGRDESRSKTLLIVRAALAKATQP